MNFFLKVKKNILSFDEFFKTKIDKKYLFVFTNFLSLIILGISGIVINIFIGRYYEPETLGIFNQTFSTYIVFSMIGVFGIHNSILNFVPKYNKKNTIEDIVSSAIKVSFFSSLITAFVYKLLIPIFVDFFGSEELYISMNIAVPGLFLFSINKVFLAIINSLKLMNLFAFYQSARYFFILIGLFCCLFSHVEGSYLFSIFSISEFILFIFLLKEIFKRLNLVFYKKHDYWQKKHISFGFNSFFSGLLLELNTRIDIIMIGFFLSDNKVGVYTFASLFAEGIAQFLIVIQNIYNPIISKIFKSHKPHRVFNFISKDINKIYFLIFILSTFLIIIYPKMLVLLTGKTAYLESYTPLIILLIGITISSGYIPFNNIFLMANLPVFHTWIILISVSINLILNFLLIPQIGINGAALGTSLSFLVNISLVRIFTIKKFKIFL